MLLRNKKTGEIGRFNVRGLGFTADGAMDARPCVRVRDQEKGKDYFVTHFTLKDLCEYWEDADIEEKREIAKDADANMLLTQKIFEEVHKELREDK